MIPTKVFVVPYRDRKANRAEFLHRMTTDILVDETEPYEIYFAHQCDSRPFNRGAMKNIGFLAIRSKYPNDYKNMTFIFHDVDTYPAKKGLIDYTTTTGVVKHYYGFKYALGGIFAIKGLDFEKSGGFPNFWGWGLEDNVMQDRCIAAGLEIDRSIFYPIYDKVNILRPFDGYIKIMSNRDVLIYRHEYIENFNDIKNLKYVFEQGKNLLNVFMLNISSFDTTMSPNDTTYREYDIRKENNRVKAQRGYFRKVWDMNHILMKKPF